jgi:hypothetical protein
MSFIGWATGLDDGIILVKNFSGFYLADLSASLVQTRSLKLRRLPPRCAQIDSRLSPPGF